MSTDELAEALVPMCVAEVDIKKMIQAADIDGDGQVSCPLSTVATAIVESLRTCGIMILLADTFVGDSAAGFSRVNDR